MQFRVGEQTETDKETGFVVGRMPAWPDQMLGEPRE